MSECGFDGSKSISDAMGYHCLVQLYVSFCSFTLQWLEFNLVITKIGRVKGGCSEGSSRHAERQKQCADNQYLKHIQGMPAIHLMNIMRFCAAFAAAV